MTTFDKIIVGLDMAGCPNRCRHCWLGWMPNGNLEPQDLEWIAESLRPFAKELTVGSWFREPDYRDDYRELWELEHKLSSVHPPHFELMSVWRAARDETYIPWLKSLGLKACQLTLFGPEKSTDYYTGRKGAFREILGATESLLRHGIAPRWQIFVNQDNIGEMPQLIQLSKELELERRCADIGREFDMFIHQGSCDGENEKLYSIRITPAEVSQIPPELIERTMKHWGKDSPEGIYGITEESLCRELAEDTMTKSLVSSTPVFHIDGKFDVYPNLSSLSPWWKLGNLKTDGAERVLQNYVNSVSPAQHARLHVPLGEMVKQCGDPDSQRLFVKGDYVDYIINRFCRSL